MPIIDFQSFYVDSFYAIVPQFIWIFWTTIFNLFIEFNLGQLSKTLIKMGGEQKECANNYPDWRLHLFPQSNLHFWYPQSISLLNQYQDIISYQMQFECITFHSGKFLQMCKCVIQKNKESVLYWDFPIFLYTGSFWNYAFGYWILAQLCAFIAH